MDYIIYNCWQLTNVANEHNVDMLTLASVLLNLDNLFL